MTDRADTIPADVLAADLREMGGRHERVFRLVDEAIDARILARSRTGSARYILCRRAWVNMIAAREAARRIHPDIR